MDQQTTMDKLALVEHPGGTEMSPSDTADYGHAMAMTGNSMIQNGPTRPHQPNFPAETMSKAELETQKIREKVGLPSNKKEADRVTALEGKMDLILEALNRSQPVAPTTTVPSQSVTVPPPSPKMEQPLVQPPTTPTEIPSVVEETVAEEPPIDPKVEQCERLLVGVQDWLKKRDAQKFFRQRVTQINKHVGYQSWHKQHQVEFDNHFDGILRNPQFCLGIIKKLVAGDSGHMIVPETAAAMIVMCAGYLAFCCGVDVT